VDVKAELSGRRLAVALVLLALVPALLAVAAARYQRPDLPPGPAAYNPTHLSQDAVELALQARELQRSHRLTDQAASQPGPVLVAARFPEPLPTLVLPPRETPYQLGELEQEVPEAFGRLDGALLLRASLEVPTGAHLVVDSAVTPDVRLASSPAGFTSVISRGGLVDLVGTADLPVRISSWDETAATNDTEPSDGRAFLLSVGGRMDVSHADIGFLGFSTGTSSGVAWRGGPHVGLEAGTPAAGEVTSSVLHHNWFGAYTYEAEDMLFKGNTFSDNIAYGFDPHDFSNGFVVEDNVANGNGRHGFIFSRGCNDNVMRNNVSFDNRGHGFMIDDGRSVDSSAGVARLLASNDNSVIGNHAYDNDGSGVEIEGGTGNVVRDNLLERNHIGVRIKDNAAAEITSNEITDSRLFGIDVLEGSGTVDLADNTVSGGWASVSLAGDAVETDLGENELAGAATPLVLDGTAVRDDTVTTTIGKYFKWNPLLILWTAILGVPVVLAGRALVSRLVGRRRRYRVVTS